MKATLALRRFLAIALVLAVLVPSVQAAELVMFERAGCEWCARWDEEIGPVYPSTPEAACAPLRRVDIDAPRPDDLSDIAAIVYTPTFVLVDAGQEVARLIGYPGEDFFWPLLADRLAKLPHGCPH